MVEQLERNWDEHFSAFGDAELDAFIRTGFNNTALHTAALRVYHQRKLARENALHAELIAEIRRPHWSVTPGFVVGLVAMIAAVIAAYYSYVAVAQAQQPSAQKIQLEQSQKPVNDNSSNSSQQLSHSQNVPKRQARSQD